MTDDLETRLRTQLSDVAASLTVDVLPPLHQRNGTKRLIAATIVVLTLALAGGIAWSRIDTNNSHLANPAPSPTTRPRSTTTTMAPSPVVANAARCPEVEPTSSPSTLNARIRGLAGKLVPITASNVRVCDYVDTGRLAFSGLLTGSAATTIENTANALRLPPRLNISRCPGSPPWLITFANESQQVTVASYCGGVLSNGLFTISNSQKWFNELDLSLTTRCYPNFLCVATYGTIRGTLRLGGPTRLPAGNCLTGSVGIRRRCRSRLYAPGPQIPGTVTITATTGRQWQATTTATQRFTIEVPPGIYRVTGTSPSFNGGKSICGPAGPLMILDSSGFSDLQVVCKKS